jgi:hypothetical protein
MQLVSYCVVVPVRFPNNGSDIGRLISSYRLIYRRSKLDDLQFFDLDFMTGVMTDEFQASSRGAVGVEARERSATADRSRDPLYNQLKMYSEVYRFLGWLRPSPRSRLLFTTTLLGDAIADDLWDQPELRNGLLRECLLSVVFPNPLTANLGVANQRPFRWFLLLAQALGGQLSRDEMILAGLAVVDDRARFAFEDAVGLIGNLRGGSSDRLNSALVAYAEEMGVQPNTLKNYTRLPLGVLSDPLVDWGEKTSARDLYDEPVDIRRLSQRGRASAEWLSRAVDVREVDLDHYALDERAQFANYAFYSMLIRSGIEVGEVREHLDPAAAGCQAILDDLAIAGPGDFLYSPVQQASDEVIARAITLSS